MGILFLILFIIFPLFGNIGDRIKELAREISYDHSILLKFALLLCYVEWFAALMVLFWMPIALLFADPETVDGIFGFGVRTVFVGLATSTLVAISRAVNEF